MKLGTMCRLLAVTAGTVLGYGLALADTPCESDPFCEGPQYYYGCFTNHGSHGPMCCRVIWINCAGSSETRYLRYPESFGACYAQNPVPPYNYRCPNND